MNSQLALAIQLNDAATLSDFNWSGNAVLQQQLMSSLHSMGERFFYIWGNTGSGKSHLLQACCQTTNQSTSIYLPLHVLKEWGPDSIADLDGQRLIAIDDIDAIANDKAWEEALFHLYNRIRDNGETILVISGKHPLASLTIKLADLRSRLAWGLVAQLHELSDELKIVILQQQAKKRGFQLPISVGQFLLNRCARNMRNLEDILDHLDKASLAAQRKITVPFVKKIFNI